MQIGVYLGSENPSSRHNALLVPASQLLMYTLSLLGTDCAQCMGRERLWGYERAPGPARAGGPAPWPPSPTAPDEDGCGCDAARSRSSAAAARASAAASAAIAASASASPRCSAVLCASSFAAASSATRLFACALMPDQAPCTAQLLLDAQPALMLSDYRALLHRHRR